MNYLFADFIGFGIVFRDFPSRLRFHKFQYCSIFKVLLALFEKAYLLYQRSYFLSSTFFDIFWAFRSFLKASSKLAIRFPAAFLLGVSLLFGFQWAAVLRDSLFIIPHFQVKSSTFFDFLHKFFNLFLDRVHKNGLTSFLGFILFLPRSLILLLTSSYNINRVLHPPLPYLSQIIYLLYLRFGSKASILKSVI